jgi:hypothetical protein
MVKGVSRRVIVVRSPDPRLFEQAIFLMKDDALEGEGVTAEQIMEQAQEAAESYLRRHNPKKRGLRTLLRHRGWLWFLAGAVCSAGAALLMT